MELKALKDIPSSFLLAKRSLIVCLIVSALVVASSLVWTYMMAQTFRESAYVLTEDGRAAFASKVDSNGIDAYRKPEIVSHTKTFHDLFWNIDQFSFERKTNKSLYLIGESGRQMYLSLKAQGHYANIEAQNLEQTIKIDSINVKDDVVPYEVALYAKLEVNRTDQKSKTTSEFKASFNVYNVARTETNPHGLLIENYSVKTKVIPKKR